MVEPPNPDGSHPSVEASPRFTLALTNFTGPFDLLLGLISKHELDITEVALAQVTDEFIAYIRNLQRSGQEWALDEASEFLVIAATLLDLKAARLLPQGQVEDDEDIALLEARDLLFARLLQYRAFKEVAAIMDARLVEEGDRFPRSVTLEPQFAALLPELIFNYTPAQVAELAAKALTPREPEPTEVGLAHLHAPAVSVREQAEIIATRLQEGKPLSFRALIVDAASTLEVVARFLALLEMFRDAVIGLEQASPLGELTVHWSVLNTGWTAAAVQEEYEPAPATDEAQGAEAQMADVEAIEPERAHQ